MEAEVFVLGMRVVQPVVRMFDGHDAVPHPSKLHSTGRWTD